MCDSRSYREIFGQFKRSNAGKETKSYLYRKQLMMCPSCMKGFPINKLDIHHLIPVSKFEPEDKLHLLTNINNLVLLCRSCNSKQSNKVDLRFE